MPQLDIKTRYLSLAVEVRKVIDSLVEFVEQDSDQPDLQQMMADLMQSLETAKGRGSVFAPAHKSESFTHYEQIRTMDEALRNTELDEILRKMAAVTDATAPREQRVEDALDAIDFLYKVESRALHNFTRPTTSKAF